MNWTRGSISSEYWTRCGIGMVVSPSVRLYLVRSSHSPDGPPSHRCDFPLCFYGNLDDILPDLVSIFAQPMRSIRISAALGCAKPLARAALASDAVIRQPAASRDAVPARGFAHRLEPKLTTGAINSPERALPPICGSSTSGGTVLLSPRRAIGDA